MKTNTFTMTYGLALHLLVAPAMAGALEDGIAAYNRFRCADAMRILRPIAESGDARAQYYVADMFDAGCGKFQQDWIEAAIWYRRSAEQGQAFAQYGLGFMFEKGNGVPQDYQTALVWYRKAAEQHLSDAEDSLGSMYENGLGVPQDLAQAYMWYNLAADDLLASDEFSQDSAANERDAVAAKMTLDQIAEAQRLAHEWMAAHPGKSPQ
jgi:TPR repeat protein